MRNLVQTAQTIARSREDVRVMFRFTLRLTLFFAALAIVLFFSPSRGWILTRVMGLGPELTAYSEGAVRLIFIASFFWGFAALFRGLLASVRRTGVLAASAVLKLLVVAAVGTLTLGFGGHNGAVFGIVIWVAAYATEALVLGGRLITLHPGGDDLFVSQAPPPSRAGPKQG
jgi:Na+-driven multidrug efflux pump